MSSIKFATGCNPFHPAPKGCSRCRSRRARASEAASISPRGTLEERGSRSRLVLLSNLSSDSKRERETGRRRQFSRSVPYNREDQEEGKNGGDHRGALFAGRPGLRKFWSTDGERWEKRDESTFLACIFIHVTLRVKYTGTFASNRSVSGEGLP